MQAMIQRDTSNRVRLSEAEARKLQRMADAKGLSKSQLICDWLRRCDGLSNGRIANR
jgi:hypothetical protein